MRHTDVVRISLLLSVLGSLAAVPGCAGQGRAAGPATEGAGDYPRWVRMVPQGSQGTSFYVGVSSGASDLEGGAAAAEQEALTRISDEEEAEILSLFEKAVRAVDAEMTSSERANYENRVAGGLVGRTAKAARRDSLYVRPCEGEAGPSRGTAQEAVRVCEAYVLMSVSAVEQDRARNEILLTMRRQALERGDERFAKLLDWMLGGH
jgi:hypothetical protein